MRMRPHYLRTVRKHIYGRKERQNRFLPRSQGVSKVCQLSGCPWFCSASSSICSHSGTAVSASCERVYTFGPDGPSRIHSGTFITRWRFTKAQLFRDTLLRKNITLEQRFSG